MKKTMTYLDEAKEALGIDSDNAMAKYLGVTKQAVSNYRVGVSVMDDFVAAKVAGALKINEMIVIAAANAEREKTEDRKEFWRNFYERLGGVAATIFICVTLGIVTLGMSPATAEARPADNSMKTLYIMLNGILLKFLRKAALGASNWRTFLWPACSPG